MVISTAMNRYILISAGLLLAGCGLDPESVRAPASARDMSWSAREGTATITGSASFVYFKERYLPYSGSLHEIVGPKYNMSCAGKDVLLLPQSPASDSVVDHMARHNVMTGPAVESAEVAPFIRHVTCDADAHFTFFNLPAGVWYAVTQMGNRAVTVKKAVVKEIRTQPGQTTSVTMPRLWHYPPSWRHKPRLW
ncbi:hypothetical protein [Komagataeibacter xylinus]|uniref:hypothetical protein n=1 Tax=Komagataeibacter xylinus TaxID=28448 RepID=UPI00280B862B|nr:hypothetical protein [Komagataeibacter xylinus]